MVSDAGAVTITGTGCAANDSAQPEDFTLEVSEVLLLDDGRKFRRHVPGILGHWGM